MTMRATEKRSAQIIVFDSWIGLLLVDLGFIHEFGMTSYNNLNSHQSNFIIIAIKYNKIYILNIRKKLIYPYNLKFYNG